MQGDISGKEKIPKVDREALMEFARGISDLDKSIQELEFKVSYLPLIDSEGDTDRPFAEDLYAQREEAEEKVVRSVDWLQERLPFLDREVSRCRGNIDRVRNDAGRLANPQAKKQYVGAAKTLMREYLFAAQDRQRLKLFLDKAHVVLKRSRDGKFPGRKSQGRGLGPGSPAPLSRAGSRTGPGSGPDSPQGPTLDGSSGEGRSSDLGRGLEGILSIGPLM